MVLVNASCRWSHVCLLSTRNVTFARLLAQIIKLRAQFPDYPIKGIRMDNAGEFTSKSFDTYCASLGIEVEHPIAYVHTQNGLAESLINHIQIIARTLLLRTNLNDTAWGHAVLHATALIRLRPTASLLQSPLQMVLGYEPDISHLRTFGCAVQVPIAPPQRTKMGPQCRLGIYVGFNSPSIIRFLEPTTGDLFTARFADCHFNETMFSNRLPDAFNDATKVMKSHIPVANAPARIAIPKGQAKMDENPPQLKRGRPIGSKDIVPKKRRGKNQESTPEEPGVVLTSKELNALEEAQTHEKITNPRNTENSITYCNEIWD